MKKFMLALLCVLLTAGFAFAVDVDLKGMYYARGSYIDNSSGLNGDGIAGSGAEDSWDYFYFDHELDLTARLLVTDKTRIVINMEIKDENWLTGNTDNRAEQTGRDLDDEIDFKRVFSSHTFDAYGTVLDLGLMTGGAWMTGFGDNANGRYRVKVTQPTEWGPIIGIYEKNAELGPTNATFNAAAGAQVSNIKDSEKDDYNAYYLAMVTKLGPVNLYPLVGYLDNSSTVLDQGSDGNQGMLVILGASGTHGDFGWEAEWNYQNWKTDINPAFANDPAAEDYVIWGIYGNGWMNIGAGKVGFMAAYGNWDKDAQRGYGFGEDFTPTIFGADWASIGNTGRSEYNGVTLFQLYGSLALSEELSIFGNGTYWMSNADENADGSDNFWDKADGYEIDLGLDWKLTDQVTYTVAGAFGKISLDDNAANAANGDSPDGFARAYHRFKIDF
jgi:hypothetical protein